MIFAAVLRHSSFFNWLGRLFLMFVILEKAVYRKFSRLAMEAWPFDDSSLADVPVFAISDSRDVLSTVMIGLSRSKKRHSTFRVRAFGTMPFTL